MKKITEIIEKHDINELDTWLKNGGNPNKIVNGVTILTRILWEIDSPEDDQRVSETVQLLIEAGADVNLVIDDEYPPVLTAVTEQCVLVTKLLVKAGAQINVRSVFDTPLTLAAESQNIDLLKALLPAADNSTINEFGTVMVKPPLGFAFMYANIEMTELLIKHGANPYIKDWDNGNLPLLDSCLPKDTDVAKKEAILQILEHYSKKD